MKSRLSLFLILFLALFLRLYRLNNLELFGDELDVGYHAYSLWTSGRDYLGQKLPVYVHSFSEWRAPLLMYLTAPFVGIFGLNEWGVRLAPVAMGLLNIVLTYQLVRIMSERKGLAIISAFIMAISPWHLHYSRTAFEATLLLSLILGGTIAFLKRKWFWSAVWFALSFYSYSVANLFVPLFGFSLLLTLGVKQKDKKIAFAGLVFLVILTPLLISVLFGQAANRFNLISIFNNPETIDRIVFKRNTGLSPSLERLSYNKMTGWGKEFFSNYLTAFSPQFLFLAGDPNPRHNPPGFGQLYLIFLPFLLIGIYRLLRSKNQKMKRLVFSWLLIAPIPACLTVGGGNQATRLFLMIPPIVILIALGFEKVFDLCGKFKFLTAVAVSLLSLLSLTSWAYAYFVHYPKETYRWWHYGYKEAIGWLKQNQQDYQKIIINNGYEPALIRYLFWTEADPVFF
ncbi:glycosyltransferase family 39 protein, partial [Patescibacteria group bacterium]|nr:glycosyltransferase family 39 protein [Patescibacteria group bacterium]